MKARSSKTVSHALVAQLSMDLNLFTPKSYVLIGTTSIAIASALGLYLYQRRRKIRPPEKWEEVGKVTELFIYPLKSGRRVPLQNAECTKFAFKQTKDDERVYQLRDRYC